MPSYRPFPVLVLLAIAATLLPLRARPAEAQAGGGLNATLTAAPTTTSVGQPVSVTYSVPPSSSETFTSGLTTSSLDFGDGQTIDGGSVGPGETVAGSAAHTYANPGTYTITLTTQAPDGETGAASATVTVASQLQPPAVQLQGPATAVQPGGTASFSYSAMPAAGAGVSAITIDYGDGSADTPSAAGGNVSHAFANAGTYVVLLTAIDSNGQVGVTSTVVQVGS